MPGLILWKNQEMDRLKRDMDRLFARLWDDFCMPAFPRIPRELPYIDLSETQDNLVISAEIPGADPEDIELSMTDDRLTIKGHVREALGVKADGGQARELRYGSFSRTIQLPCRIRLDDVEARYQAGVLHVVMPKCRPEKARGVKIKVT